MPRTVGYLTISAAVLDNFTGCASFELIFGCIVFAAVGASGVCHAVGGGRHRRFLLCGER